LLAWLLYLKPNENVKQKTGTEMSSTIMKDSMVGDAWITQAVQANPITQLDNGSFLSGPVRINYPSFFVPKANNLNPTEPPKYECTLLFPPIANVGLMFQAVTNIVAAAYPSCVQNGQIYGCALPFNDQGKPGKNGPKKGYTPGCVALNAKNLSPVRVGIMTPNGFVDVTDKSKVYSGVWGIVNFNFYATKTGPSRIAVGLNSVVIYGDDMPLGGAAPIDPNTAFAGIKAGAPISVPSGAFGSGVPLSGPVPHSMLAGMPAALGILGQSNMLAGMPSGLTQEQQDLKDMLG
jgi:hypothetical protein